MGGGGTKEVGAGVELGRFACEYVGSMPVSKTTGYEIYKKAALGIQLTKAPRRKVILVSTTTAIYILEADTKDTDASFPLDMVLTALLCHSVALSSPIYNRSVHLILNVPGLYPIS